MSLGLTSSDLDRFFPGRVNKLAEKSADISAFFESHTSTLLILLRQRGLARTEGDVLNDSTLASLSKRYVVLRAAADVALAYMGQDASVAQAWARQADGLERLIMTHAESTTQTPRDRSLGMSESYSSGRSVPSSGDGAKGIF